MADPKQIEILVEQAVDAVLNGILPTLREQLTRQVLQAIGASAEPSAPAAAAVASGDNSEALNRALSAVQTGTTQVEILDAMIEGASQFAARSALYVVRGANAVGWKARGFADNETVRSGPLELSDGLPAKAIGSRAIITGRCAEFQTGFEAKVGESSEGCMVIPLLVRDKVVAILYADGGLDQHQLDTAALQSLVRTTGLWLEVFATRKATGGAPSQAMAAAAVVPAPAAGPSTKEVEAPDTHTETVSTHTEEPVPHTEETVTHAEGAGATAVETVPPPPAEEVHEPEVQAPPPPPPPAVVNAEDTEVHKKAKRFAKLLVDEIKLYNQGKVTEGRQNRDLYDRLKDDIEKSRASYEKRYGTTAAKEGNYFNQELVRILADNDASLFGNNFRQ